MGPVNVERRGITQFEGKNFDNWKFRVEALLEENEVKDLIIEEPPEVKDPKWKKNDSKCKSLIIQCVADSHLEYIKEKSTAKEIWDSLLKTFDRKGIASQLFLRKKLLTLKLEENEEMEPHFVKFDETIRQLKCAGAKLEEDDVVCHLLLTLPKSFDNVTTAIETLSSNNLTLEFVKGRLLDEQIKRKHNQESKTEITSGKSTAFNANPVRKMSTSGNERTTYNGKPKFQFKCYNCGRIGHKKSDCRFIKRIQTQANSVETSNSKEESMISFMAGSNHNGHDKKNILDVNWYIDSGSTDHLINNEKLFSFCQNLTNPIEICVAKTGETLKATKIGYINVSSFVKGKCYNCKIENVLFVPKLRYNLLSVRKMEMSGIKVVFENSVASLMKNNAIIAIGKRYDKLYEIKFQKSISNASICNQKEDYAILWHKRLGHLGMKNMENLLKYNMVSGLPEELNSMKMTKLCKTCIHGKQTRLPFIKTDSRSKRVLEIIHTDVCGYVEPTTWDKKKYFLTFIDDFSHFTVVYLLKEKSEVFKFFKQYESYVTSHFGKKISQLRCDNGGEYVSNEFNNFCLNKGIQLIHTIPYTPEQNGVAERMNRTLVDKARSMIFDARLSKEMWGEAVLAATYITNRCPTITLNNKTPAEIWYGIKPDLSKLKIFGSVGYIHIPKEKRHKFDSKCKEGIMIGYAPNGYRLWDEDNRRIILARDVKFDEEKFMKNTLENELEDEYSEEEHEETEEEENKETKEEIIQLRRSERQRKPPVWLKDYKYAHLVLSAENYIDNIPNSLEETKKRPDYKYWKEAVDEELDSLKKNETWVLIERPENVKVIDSKWIFKIKRDEHSNINQYKARLVARGFLQREGLDYFETYSPVAKISTIRLLLAYANHYNFLIHQMDVKTAFLNGILKEDVYMKIPEGLEVKSNLICKLNRSLYGLKQAPRCWNERFSDFILSLGFIRSTNDFCLYSKISKISKIYIVLYVDDILIIGSQEKDIQEVKSSFSKEFQMKDMGVVKHFLGLQITRNMDKRTLRISQKNCIEGVLKRFGMENCKTINTPIEINLKLNKCTNKNEQTSQPYRELVGCLMYIMIGSRPDICLAVNYFSRFQDCANDEHWNHLKRILRYLKGTINYELIYKQNKTENNILVGYVDSDWANDIIDRRSVTGYLFKFFGCVVSWRTKKQESVALSSTEAEYIALSSALCEAIWLKKILTDMDIIIKDPIILFEDNQGCIYLSKNPENNKRTKHIDIRYHFIKEKISNSEIELKYIKTENQEADILTKSLGGTLFKKFRETLGLGLIEEGC